MKKIAVGPKAKGVINIDTSVENLLAVAKALNKDISDLTVTIQDREGIRANRSKKDRGRIKLFGGMWPLPCTCLMILGRYNDEYRWSMKVITLHHKVFRRFSGKLTPMVKRKLKV